MRIVWDRRSGFTALPQMLSQSVIGEMVARVSERERPVGGGRSISEKSTTLGLGHGRTDADGTELSVFASVS